MTPDLKDELKMPKKKHTRAASVDENEIFEQSKKNVFIIPRREVPASFVDVPDRLYP